MSDEEEKEEALHRLSIITDYKTGRFKKLFDEIDGLVVKGDELERDLWNYLQKYKGKPEKIDEWRLMDVLHDGIDIARFINIYD